MHACRQVLLVSTIWNTRHAAVEVCTKEMAPETRSCADADSFVAVNPSGLEHDHKGVSFSCAGSIAVSSDGPLAVDTVSCGPFAACKDIWHIELLPRGAAS